MQPVASIYINCYYNSHLSLPNLSDGHRLFHVAVEGVALLSSENVEDLDAAITLASCDVLVVRVETDAESLL